MMPNSVEPGDWVLSPTKAFAGSVDCVALRQNVGMCAHVRWSDEYIVWIPISRLKPARWATHAWNYEEDV